MNATPAAPQTPIASDPAQLSSAAAVNSVNYGGKDGDFAAALSKAGAKPARKTAGHGPGGSGSDGGQLPVTGNISPPAAMAGAAAGATPDRAAAGRTGSNDSAGSATAIGSAAGGAATQSTAAGAAAISGADVKAAEQAAAGVSTQSPAAANDRGAAGLVAGFSASMRLPAGAGAGAPNAALGPPAGPGSAGTPVVGAMQDSRTAQAIPPVPELAPPKGAAAAGRPAVGGNPGRATLTATAATAANDAATSARSSAATGTVNGAATGTANGTVNGTDPSAQAASAAAIAAATGVVADNAATTDSTLSAPADLATPAAAGAKGVAGANGAAGANGTPTQGLLVAGGRPTAAAQAASAAVQTETVGTSGADRHAGSDNGNSLLSDTSAGAAGAAQFSVNSAGATDVAAAPTLKVAAGVDTPEFGQGLADRVSWMVDNNLSSAKLQINPPQLGPIEVRISVQGDHAQVWLTSHSAVTRDALESSSPKLREMLGAQGFGQVSVDVSQRNFQDRSAHAQPYQWTSATNLSSAAAAPAAAVSRPRLSSGAVDAYA